VGNGATCIPDLKAIIVWGMCTVGGSLVGTTLAVAAFFVTAASGWEGAIPQQAVSRFAIIELVAVCCDDFTETDVAAAATGLPEGGRSLLV